MALLHGAHFTQELVGKAVLLNLNENLKGVASKVVSRANYNAIENLILAVVAHCQLHCKFWDEWFVFCKVLNLSHLGVVYVCNVH